MKFFVACSYLNPKGLVSGFWLVSLKVDKSCLELDRVG